MKQCVHKWDIDRLNVGTCRRCDEVRQFPLGKGEVIILKKGLLKKEENMNPNIRGRYRYYKEHKEEIIRDLLSIGRAATRAKWKIPEGGTLSGLTKRWMTPEQIQSIPRGRASSQGRVSTEGKEVDSKTGAMVTPPKFPEFNDTWDSAVQLKWLEIYDTLRTTV